MDYVMSNLQSASGTVATRLLKAGMDVGVLRPYIGHDGNSYVDRYDPQTGGVKATLTSNTATLTFDQWRLIDRRVIDVAVPQLKLIGDLRGRGLTYSVDGMANPVLAYQKTGDITPATMSMSGLRKGDRDQLEVDIGNIPLPIIHKDFSFDIRQLNIANNGRGPLPNLQTRMLTKATRQCVKAAELLALGVSGSYAYGGGTIYGLTNFPTRNTKVMTLPTSAGWTPQTFIDEINDMIQGLKDELHEGPYVLYLSSDWGQYLNSDYSQAYNGSTLMTRLRQITDISDVVVPGHLNGFQAILLEPQEDNIQIIVGMEFKAIQWETEGGMELHYKVMGIVVPWLFVDVNSTSYISHGVGA